MIRTTRIKHTQAPRVIIDDLSSQCNGVRQTFTLRNPVPEYAPHSLIFNGQLYTNTAYHEWYKLSVDRKSITTAFMEAPDKGIHKNLIFVVGATGTEDLAVQMANSATVEARIRQIVREEIQNAG